MDEDIERWNKCAPDAQIVIHLRVDDEEYPLDSVDHWWIATREELERERVEGPGREEGWEEGDWPPEGLSYWDILTNAVFKKVEWSREVWDTFGDLETADHWEDCSRCVDLYWVK